ncbi:hypothetical protein AAG570_013863 [Ranatra chinensis]|uniref:APCDD1 domain-containing protein n=1 Tax=Ranatra chinensis TaxID=642074 RepID=A0ABD0YFC2_9HEMI
MHVFFFISGSSWHAEYRFYSDPTCQTGTLTAAAEGHLRPAKISSPPRVHGATDFDFMVERAFLTLFDPGLVQSLQDDRRCGPPGIWQVGVTRDVTPSQGCAPLGITVPSVEYELVRVETEPSSGHTVLMLGHTDGPKKAAAKRRPTAFQPPLLQCNGPELPPLSHLLNGYSPAPRGPLPATLLTLAAVTLLTALL